MSNHGETERHILRLFKRANIISFRGVNYQIKVVGKPKPNKGECKTDIYIQALNSENKELEEFKISVKQSDADFLENKVSLERAEEIFGKQASSIIQSSIETIQNDFLDDFLVYFKKGNRTESKCLRIGWKFEFINKHGGKRSGEIQLSDSQKKDIYSGVNLNKDKKNSKVNGVMIPNSGVANFMLEVDSIHNNLYYYLDRLADVDRFAVAQKVYFACKAINYRAIKNKWDGNRPLSVYIDWNLVGNKVFARVIMDEPLVKKANEIGLNIRRILNQLKISNSNFDDLKKYLDSSINIYS